MGLLKELATKYKTVSIVGMAKNSGKTTALNFLIEEAMDEGMLLGVTSTGRDGEATDLVTGTDKPRVYLYTGTLVSVPTQLYELADAGLEILRMTNYHTSIGQLMLCRVVDSGYVQIAGPVNTADHKRLCEEMFSYGADMVLIDGAIDRKSIAAPDTSDAIVLATGAVLSRSLRRVVEETAHIVGLYQLPVLQQGEARSLLQSGPPDRIIILDRACSEDSRGAAEGTLKARILDLKTGLAASRFLDDEITDESEYIFIPGALTNSVIADINPEKLKRVKMILKDPTKIFIDSMTWQQLRKRGFAAYVLDNITVAAVTVNPMAPLGYAFGHEELRSAMEGALKGIPVIDVRM